MLFDVNNRMIRSASKVASSLGLIRSCSLRHLEIASASISLGNLLSCYVPLL